MSNRLRTTRSARTFFGEVTYPAGGTHGPRTQGNFQLVAIVEGSAEITVDASTLKLAAGACSLLLPGRREFFQFSRTRKTHHTWCEIAPTLVQHHKLPGRCRLAPSITVSSHRFSQIMELGLALPRDNSPAAASVIDALGITLLTEYLYSSTASAGEEPIATDALRRVLDWVGDSGHEAIDLRQLARIGGVSPAQLVKLFRQTFDTTPIRYLWEERTRRGVQLLRDTGLTVSEIAFRCGFQTPFHFSRWVKTMEKSSPRELRQQAWQTPQKTTLARHEANG